MKTYDLRPWINEVERSVRRHNLGRPGAYARWTRPQNGKPDLDLGLNPYGCADAANILYTIGRFPREPGERQDWIAVLQSLQEPSTGLFHEATHHDIHCTAHCVAALELFDARPRHRLAGLHELRERDALHRFLDGLSWVKTPWPASHQGAGLYAALTITGEASETWQDAYFEWLWREADPRTGFWRRGCTPPPWGDGPKNAAPIFHHLAGSFHYLFNHQAARRPLRFPERMIESCLEIFQTNAHASLGTAIGFAEIDWVYCTMRALRQSGHRFGDCQAALRALATRLLDATLARDPAHDPACDDLHNLFGTLCALAELQQALPGCLRTEEPLKLVLDRRPFI